ncbi:MAG: XisH family protein [Spirulina sp.]
MEEIRATKMPMPAKDIYHNAVRLALVKDGWEILTENYTLEYGGARLYVDIAAEKSIAAEKQGRQILVEVKSFLGRSFVNDLEQAVGQYIVYRDIVLEQDLDFQLYLAITKGTYQNYFKRKLTQMIINRNQVNLLVVDSESEAIEQWID